MDEQNREGVDLLETFIMVSKGNKCFSSKVFGLWEGLIYGGDSHVRVYWILT